MIPLNELLDAVSLEGLVSLDEDRLAPAPTGEARAASLTMLISLAALLSGEQPTTPVAAPAVSQDWILETAGATGLRVTSRADQPVEIRCSETSDCWRVSVEHPSTGALLATAGRGFVILDGTGHPLAVRWGPQEGWQFDRLEVPTRQHPAASRAPSLSPPLARWLSDAPDWLARTIAPLRGGGPVGLAAAAGLYRRFGEPSDPAAVRDLVARLIAGEPDPATARVERWVRELSEAQVAELDERAQAEVARIEGALTLLEESPAPGEPAWVEELRDFLLRRDDLAGVLEILGMAGAAGPLAEALLDLDEQAVSYLRALPIEARVVDSRLSQVWVRSPSAWWAVPARLT